MGPFQSLVEESFQQLLGEVENKELSVRHFKRESLNYARGYINRM